MLFDSLYKNAEKGKFLVLNKQRNMQQQTNKNKKLLFYIKGVIWCDFNKKICWKKSTTFTFVYKQLILHFLIDFVKILLKLNDFIYVIKIRYF